MGLADSYSSILASLQFAGLSWFPVAAGLAVAGCLVAWWANRRTWAAMGGAGRACAVLKFGGFVLLALCLLQPQWVGERPMKGENVVAVLVDNGRGLEVGGKGEELADALEAGDQEGGWLETLGETFTVERFVFDDGVRPGGGDGAPGFDGPASGLAGALRGASARLGSRSVAAFLVFTDGVATDWPDAEVPVPGLEKVFPVVPAAESEPDDLAISGVSVSTSPYEDAPVEVRATVTARGTPMEEVEVRVTDSAGAEVAREVPGPGGMARLRFQPSLPGVSFYQVEVAASDGGDDGEATLANNVRHLAVDHGGQRRRLLYVAGRPNWEYKFLNRALAEDGEVDLIGLVRVAKREPKFEFRGRSGESSNPLFRGFEADQAPEYDQPVLQRLNTRDEVELAGGFPKLAEELFTYDGLIFDDLEAAFFSPDQLALVRQFVAHRGGGFLMLGGQESLNAGGYANTPVGDVLPVSTRQAEGGVTGSAAGRLAWSLTRDGMLEPWVRLRDTEEEERERAGAMPGFLTLSESGRPKPGAALLAESDGRLGLAAHRFGNGRSAALAVGDFWRWGFRDPKQKPDMEKAWRQLVRWLVADVPDRVELTVEPAEGAHGVFTVRAAVRDPAFEPDPEVDVHLAVTRPDGEEFTLTAGPAEGGEPGVFVADVLCESPGGYRVRATATRYDNTTAGDAEAGWTHDPDAAEFASLGVNRGLLDALARSTGGRVLGVGDLAEFARSLPESDLEAVETTRLDLWHVPLTFLLGLGFLGAEWALRRSRGYA